MDGDLTGPEIVDALEFGRLSQGIQIRIIGTGKGLALEAIGAGSLGYAAALVRFHILSGSKANGVQQW